MALFFTADTHFGHGGARALYRRPFASTAAMDEALIENWNATVGPADEVWHLGDFAIRQSPARMAAILERLVGRKHLIVGNNDPETTRTLAGWASVAHYGELVQDGVRIVLCHYPFRTWNGMGKGAVNLHGHSHGRLRPQTRQADVGVDVRDFRPVELDDIMARFRRRPAID